VVLVERDDRVGVCADVYASHRPGEFERGGEPLGAQAVFLDVPTALAAAVCLSLVDERARLRLGDRIELALPLELDALSWADDRPDALVGERAIDRRLDLAQGGPRLRGGPHRFPPSLAGRSEGCLSLLEGSKGLIGLIHRPSLAVSQTLT
jgi:hypothetical protein